MDFNAHLVYCLNNVLNVKALGTFNQKEALLGAFSVIVKPVVEPMDRFTALAIIPIIRAKCGDNVPGQHPSLPAQSSVWRHLAPISRVVTR